MEVTYRPKDIEKIIQNLSFVSQMELSSEDDAALIIDRPNKINQVIDYHVGILGMFSSSHRIADRIRKSLKKDMVSPKYSLWIRYVSQFFGETDLEMIAARMQLFKPNYLIALNIGRTGDKIGSTGPYNLATLSHAINAEFGSGNPGAYHGQQPYSLVFLTDKPLEDERFIQYQRLCNEKGIIAAKKQFSTFETEELIQHIKDTCVGHLRTEFALRDINDL